MFFFCISLNLVIIYMLILQNFHISMHLIKHHLKIQCLNLLLQLIDGMRTSDDSEEEGLVGNTPLSL